MDAEHEEREELDAESRKPADSDAGAGRTLAGEGLARKYAARRRGWIAEHSRDDRFLIFIGVAVALAVVFLVAYWAFRDRNLTGENPPLPLTKLFHAPAKTVAPGVVSVRYGFPYDKRYYLLREACPQLGDWQLKGTMSSQGIMVGGKATYRPFFEPGYVAVEADAALVTGSQLTLILASIYDHREGDYFRFDLIASRGKDWPSTAQLSRYEDGSRSEATTMVEIPALRTRRDPPLFHRVKLELGNNRLTGYFAPPGGKLKKVVEMQVGNHLGAGKVILTGELSHTAWDNVVITGRPHMKFVEKRTQLYYLFNMHKDEEGRAESSPPTTARRPAKAESPAPSGE